MVSHNLLCHVRPAALMHRTRKYPIFWRFVTCLAMPLSQSLYQIIMCRNRFLGTFGLADANNILNDGACDLDLFRLNVNVLPFSIRKSHFFADRSLRPARGASAL